MARSGETPEPIPQRTVADPRFSYEVMMLRWALVFLIIGLAAGLLGFSGIAGASFAIAKILFFIFMIGFVVLFVLGLAIGRRLGL